MKLASNENLVILGKSGSGKSVFDQVYHASSWSLIQVKIIVAKIIDISELDSG